MTTSLEVRPKHIEKRTLCFFSAFLGESKCSWLTQAEQEGGRMTTLRGGGRGDDDEDGDGVELGLLSSSPPPIVSPERATT
jgi:hypothetical protein